MYLLLRLRPPYSLGGLAPFSSSSIYRPFNRLTFFPHSPFLPHFLLGLSRSFRPTRSLAPSLPLFLFSPSGCSPPLGLNPVGHSGPLGCWLLYPASLPFLHLSFHPFHPHAPPQPGLSRSFRPTRSWTVLLLLFPPLTSCFHPALTQSVIPAHSVFGFLPLALLLSIIFTFFHSLDSVGHSGPLGLWLPLHLFSLLSSWFLGFPTTALTQSVIPAHSVSGNLISLSFFSLSLFFFTLACTQSVIPAHSVTGYLPPLVLFPFHWTPFSQSHHPVGHSGPLGYWLHLGLSTSFWFISLSTSYPIPSLPCRSFRPTRQLTSSSP